MPATLAPSHTKDELRRLLELQRQLQRAQGVPDVATRRSRIDRLLSVLLENSEAFASALNEDFGTRPRVASLLSDVLGPLIDATETRARFPHWMRSKRAMGWAAPLGLSTRVDVKPLGVVGIIGPWNYPLTLVVQPTIAAFAAGNRVIVKFPEAAGATGELFAAKVAQAFTPGELTVVLGGSETAAEFSSLPFDHLFFTGSPSVGKLVQRAASENLVPVTLELGGKNPAVVGLDASVRRAAERIACSRVVNAGQICLSTDYAFVPRDRLEAFVSEVLAVWRRRYPSIEPGGDFVSIIDEKNYDRVLGLLEDAWRRGASARSHTPSSANLPDAENRLIAPTVLTGVTEEMAIASEEVFGPVLTVYPYDHVEEVIAYVNARPSPLAAYWHGGDTSDFRAFRDATTSGGVTRNDFALHFAIPGTPFGGVGYSGMGAYHGKAGFDAFSHRRTVAQSRLPVSMAQLMAAPYGDRVTGAVEKAVELQRGIYRRRVKRSLR